MSRGQRLPPSARRRRYSRSEPLAIASTVNPLATCARQRAGSTRPISRTASASSSARSQTIPVSPSATISGTDPALSATTGVPQAIASSCTRPKGSSHVGKSKQAACASSLSRHRGPHNAPPPRRLARNDWRNEAHVRAGWRTRTSGAPLSVPFSPPQDWTRLPLPPEWGLNLRSRATHPVSSQSSRREDPDLWLARQGRDIAS
jgi:hypothetical protein